MSLDRLLQGLGLFSDLDHELTALTRDTVQAQLRMVQLHDLSHQRQTEPVTGLLPDLLVVGAEELLEDALLLLGRDPDARIAYADLDRLLGLLGEQGDGAARAVECNPPPAPC
jgi:hypothetical protein